MRIVLSRDVLRRAFGLILALMLALTGQSLAIARAAPGPSGQMVLCTGSGPVMIYLDDTGAPAGPPVWCPDGALGLLDLAALPQPDAPARALRPLDLPWPGAAQARAHAPAAPRARAPPLTV